MDVSVVVFIHCTIGELRNLTVFDRAAEFTKWSSIITIRCDDTGEELQVSCTPPADHKPGTTVCHGRHYFAQQWTRKNGPIT